MPGSAVRLTVADGPAGDVLMYVAAQFDQRVEDIDTARGAAPDDWGHADRPIRGGTATSNHASATAIDLNATRHPLGARGTFTTAQVTEIRAILDEVAHVVRWGGDYSGRVDAMHFEIATTAATVATVARRLAQEDDMAGEGPNIQAAVLTGGPSTRAIKVGADGKLVYPPGVDPTGVLGRVADVQAALTRDLPLLRSQLTKLNERMSALADALNTLTERLDAS